MLPEYTSMAGEAVVAKSTLALLLVESRTSLCIFILAARYYTLVIVA